MNFPSSMLQKLRRKSKNSRSKENVKRDDEKSEKIVKVNQQLSMKTTIDDPTTDRDGYDRKFQRKQILRFVKSTLEKGPSGLKAEFASMKRFNDFEKMKAFKEAQERGKNRYKDVGCLDNNRVKLSSPPWPHDYIHANYVATSTNPKRFICTQAPLENTCADFWFMCLQEKAEAIFMLCNLTEKGSKKCFEYYPNKEKPSLEFEEKGYKVTVKFESTNKLKFEKPTEAKVMETTLWVEGPEGLKLKTSHYHWIDWPDRGVPTADLAICELLGRTRLSKAPIVIHCSAGIGRTGSVVMIEYILDQIFSGQTIEESDKILQKIREQRNNSIQTDLQYLFVHQVMMGYFLDKKLFSTQVAMAHVAFTERYLKAVQ